MKRRTFRKLRADQPPEHHHNVYVVLLDSAAARLRVVRAANPARDPKKRCVYVGMTGLTPEERFANHQQGIKSASEGNCWEYTVNYDETVQNLPPPAVTFQTEARAIYAN